MNISEFERNKPRKTHKAIKKLIDKYNNIVTNLEIMDDEDCLKVEMAADFLKELQEVMITFKSGE
jgi:flagellar capping protein FliD